ncbi:hypothetical protein BDZ97DRAFT_1801148 [Flammula alnicola]|nr:hypothetical protein BDZ97DRAFT_1801148 [Flammula alnicola]
MKSVFAPVAAALFLAGSAVAQLTINTPLNVVVCQPLLITWTGGTPPYFLSLLPGNQPSAAALLDFGTQTGTQLTWTVNITAGTLSELLLFILIHGFINLLIQGTSLGLDLRDSTGALAQTAPFTVQSSSNTACLTASGSSLSPSASGSSTIGASTTGVTTTTPVGVSTTPATTATTPATSKSVSTVSGSSSATTHAASTTPSSGAVPTAHAGIAGALGVGAAFLALLA